MRPLFLRLSIPVVLLVAVPAVVPTVVLVAVPDVVPDVLLVVLAIILVVTVLSTANMAVDDDDPPSTPPRLSGTNRALRDAVVPAEDVTDRANAVDALLLF